MSKVKFYLGIKSLYDASEHADGLYFTTDTYELLLNGNLYSSSVEEITASDVDDIWNNN